MKLNMPQFHYPFSCWWVCGLFLVFTTMNNAADFLSPGTLVAYARAWSCWVVGCAVFKLCRQCHMAAVPQLMVEHESLLFPLVWKTCTIFSSFSIEIFIFFLITCRVSLYSWIIIFYSVYIANIFSQLDATISFVMVSFAEQCS